MIQDSNSDIPSLFKKPHAPEVSIIIPKYPSMDVRTQTNIESKDFVIYGERLEFYFIVSFDKLKKKWESYLENGGLKAPFIIREKEKALYSVFSRLKFEVHLEHSSNIINPSTSHHIIGYKNIIDLKSNEEDKKKLMEKIDDVNEYIEVSECILLPNGNILYPIRTVIDVQPKYIGELVDIVVIASYKRDKFAFVTGTLQEIPLDNIECSIKATCSAVIIEPLKVILRSSKNLNKRFISVTLKNASPDIINIEDTSLHMTQTEFGKKSINLEEFYRSNVIMNEEFPIKLLPKEAYSFVIETELFPSAVGISPLSLALFKPSLIISWNSPSLSSSLIAQHYIPLESPSVENLLITFELDDSSISINTIYNLKIILSNLSENEYDLVLSLDSPDMNVERSGYFNLASDEQNVSKISDMVLQSFRDHKKDNLKLFYSEKIIDIGKIEPKEEKSFNVQFIAFHEGHYEIKDIKLFSKTDQKEVSFTLNNYLEFHVVK